MNLAFSCSVFCALLGITLAYYNGNYVPKSFYIIDHYGHKSEPVYLRNKRDTMSNYIRTKRSDSHSSANSHASASSSSYAGAGAGGGGGAGAGGNPTYHPGGGGGGFSSSGSAYFPYWFHSFNYQPFNQPSNYQPFNYQPFNSQPSNYQPFYFPRYRGYVPSFVNPDDFFKELQNMFNFLGSQAGHGQAFASSFSSASSGAGPTSGSGQGGLGSGHDAGYQGSGNIPTLFSRFGEAQGSGIQASGSAQGQKGAFSSSSTSIDSDGKIKYSVQSGKL